MSEVFQVPEPSKEAVRAYNAQEGAHTGSVQRGLLHAYRVDVPQIVRAEVEWFFKWWINPKNFGGIDDPRTTRDYLDAYLRERFGGESVAPDTSKVYDLSVTAELDKRLTLRPEGHILPGIPATFTEADRARLDKLERFVTALAKERKASGDIPNTLVYYPDLQRKLAEASEAVVDAAREFLEG